MNLSEYISIDANRRFGQPTLTGTRITVSDVLNWLGNGMTKESILEDYPELKESMINAALFYAASKHEHLGFAS
jgi:uncharacterized protein (DUF433 family)